jgi:hypothetical protein
VINQATAVPRSSHSISFILIGAIVVVAVAAGTAAWQCPLTRRLPRKGMSLLPPVLEREVPGDPHQEGAQPPAGRIEPVWISEKPDEQLLGDVLRRGRRAVVEGGLELSVGHVAF